MYLGEHKGEKTFQEIEENHHSYLLSVKETEEDARSSLLYSYKHSINGFAAVLTLEEAERLSRMPDFLRRSYLILFLSFVFSFLSLTQIM